mmetsp:Transcript_7755/g.8534  ORF Transcript_7755/g.8534 Transcript_7755/m.8534 type:complete len:252 (+) Transcript_7755:287-1042(+)
MALKNKLQKAQEREAFMETYSERLLQTVAHRRERTQSVRQAALRLMVDRFHSYDDNLYHFADTSFDEHRKIFFDMKRDKQRKTKKNAFLNMEVDQEQNTSSKYKKTVTTQSARVDSPMRRRRKQFDRTAKAAELNENGRDSPRDRRRMARNRSLTLDSHALSGKPKKRREDALAKRKARRRATELMKAEKRKEQPTKAKFSKKRKPSKSTDNLHISKVEVDGRTDSPGNRRPRRRNSSAAPPPAKQGSKGK